MVVEDEEVVSNLLYRLLSEDHEVEIALSGREALTKFAPGRCDVTLIDLGMPGIPGDQVAREIKKVAPSVANVLITGWELLEADPRLSVFDFRLQKPFDDIDKVQEVIAQAIELRDARAEERN